MNTTYTLTEGNDALNRALLMMRYDMGKTLDENYNIINEQKWGMTNEQLKETYGNCLNKLMVRPTINSNDTFTQTMNKYSKAIGESFSYLIYQKSGWGSSKYKASGKPIVTTCKGTKLSINPSVLEDAKRFKEDLPELVNGPYFCYNQNAVQNRWDGPIDVDFSNLIGAPNSRNYTTQLNNEFGTLDTCTIFSLIDKKLQSKNDNFVTLPNYNWEKAAEIPPLVVELGWITLALVVGAATGGIGAAIGGEMAFLGTSVTTEAAFAYLGEAGVWTVKAGLEFKEGKTEAAWVDLAFGWLLPIVHAGTINKLGLGTVTESQVIGLSKKVMGKSGAELEILLTKPVSEGGLSIADKKIFQKVTTIPKDKWKNTVTPIFKDATDKLAAKGLSPEKVMNEKLLKAGGYVTKTWYRKIPLTLAHDIPFLEFYKKLIKWAGVENSDTFVKDFEEAIKNKQITPPQLTKIMKTSKDFKDFENKTIKLISTDTLGAAAKIDSLRTTNTWDDMSKQELSKYQKDTELYKRVKEMRAKLNTNNPVNTEDNPNTVSPN